MRYAGDEGADVLIADEGRHGCAKGLFAGVLGCIGFVGFEERRLVGALVGLGTKADGGKEIEVGRGFEVDFGSDLELDGFFEGHGLAPYRFFG
jgi:hypothetical protein